MGQVQNGCLYIMNRSISQKYEAEECKRLTDTAWMETKQQTNSDVITVSGQKSMLDRAIVDGDQIA